MAHTYKAAPQGAMREGAAEPLSAVFAGWQQPMPRDVAAPSI
jgi:hypothetical protein